MDKTKLYKATDLSKKIDSLQKMTEHLLKAHIANDNSISISVHYVGSYLWSSIASKNSENENHKLANEIIIMVYKHLKKELKECESEFKKLYPNLI